MDKATDHGINRSAATDTWITDDTALRLIRERQQRYTYIMQQIRAFGDRYGMSSMLGCHAGPFRSFWMVGAAFNGKPPAGWHHRDNDPADVYRPDVTTADGKMFGAVLDSWALDEPVDILLACGNGAQVSAPLPTIEAKTNGYVLHASRLDVAE